MKLTKWEVERILEALDTRLGELQTEGRRTKSFERLIAKVSAHAEMTGKGRGKD